MVRRRPTPGGEQQRPREMDTATKDEEEAPGIGQHTGASSSLEVLGGAGHEDRAFPVAHDHGAAIQQLAGTSPTLHKLLHIQEDRLDLSFVEKVTVPPEHLFALCNLLTPGSAILRDDRSVVDFDVLNKSERRVVGLYGCKETLLDVLRSLRVLDAATERQLKHDKLAPGIYGVLCEKVLYVLYWHPGSRMEPPSRKGVSCNFIRYIVDLCDSVYVCLDQKILEAFLSHSASRTAAKSKRVERKKIFSVKESEDNIQLQPGFRIFPPAMKPDDALTMLVAGNSSQELDLRPRLSAGLLRCGVLTPTVCPPRKVDRQWEITVKLGKLQENIMEWSKAHNVMIDRQLPDQDLRCLLHCAELPGGLDYRALVKRSEERRDQVKNAFYKGPEALKRAQQRIVVVLNKALRICLQHNYSWEVTALGGAECFQILQENAHRSLSLGEQDMIKLERELCMIWMDYPEGVEAAEQLSLLFIGSEISFQSNNEFVIENLTQSHVRVTGPILYGQEFLAISKRTGSRHRFTLLPENGSRSRASGGMGPVIVTSQSLCLVSDDGTTYQQGTCRVSPTSNGMMNWIQAYVGEVNALPLDLRGKADILSRIIESGHKADADGISRTLEDVSRSTAPARDFRTAFPDQRIDQLMRHNGLQGCEVRAVDGSHEATVRKACRAVFHDAVKKFEAHILTSLVKKILLPMLEGKKKHQPENSQSLEMELQEQESRFLQQLRSQVVQRDPGRCNLQITRCYPVKSQLSRLLGFLRLQGLLNQEDEEIRVQYRLEETEDERVSWQMTELTPLKKDLEKSARDKNHVIVPRFSHPYKLIDLDPSSQRLMKVVTVNTGETLIFVENIKDETCSLDLYIRPKIGGPHTGADYPYKAFHRGFDLVAFDEHSSFLALYDRNYKKISIYKFDESFRHLDFYSDAQLEECAGIRDLTDMIFIPGKRELVLIDTGNTVRVLELSHDSMVKSSNITLPAAATHACVTTNGACLLVFSKALSSLQGSQPSYDGPAPTETALLSDADPSAEAAALPCSSTATEEAVGTTPPTDGSTTLEAAIPNGQQSDGSNTDQVQVQDVPLEMHVYLLNDRLSFLKTVQLDYLATDMTSIEATVTTFDSQMHLIVLEGARPASGINSHVLEITCASQLFQLRSVKGKQTVGEQLPETEQTETASICPELDYIPLVFDKYPASPPLLDLKRELFVHFLLGGRSKAAKGDLKDRCIDYVTDALAKMKVETWKDFTNLTIHLRSDILENYLGPDALLVGTCISSRNVAALGNWIRRLFCLVPIQLARAENNSLRPLRDGLQIPPSMNYGNAVSLSQIIRFGFYDAVLSHWTGSLKVVSSMGKQSSGKSYLLNHLSGSLLDVAGDRCTDGVWMTMRTTETCLYVILDFEGLGSVERSETEDMLLSILNAAVSNITIFNKKDFHLDKETEAVFARFQSGMSLVKEDSRLFKGTFYMAIKDVAQTDVEDLKSEFWGKIQHMCGKSNEENFLTKMYGSDCVVAALPPFQSKAYHESICELAETVTDDTDAVFQNGSTFATDLKLLIAQFSAKDWSPMDTKRIALRIDNLERHLKTAISLGSLDRKVDNAFINFETREAVADTPVQLDEHVFALSDTGLELSPHQESQVVGSILQSLREKFEAVVKRTGCKDEIWHAAFERFLSAVAERRHQRVSQWLKCNTEEFQIDGDIQKLQRRSEAMLGDMRQSLSLCNSKCQDCFLLCVLEKSHPSGHTCKGSHSCSQTCEYCQKAGDGSTECGDSSGHEGPHDCKLRNHTCGDVCSKFAISSNCSKQCYLRPNHEGDHLCNTSQHKCGLKCSLESCKNMCTIDLDKDHDRHICHEKLCPMDCGMTGCNKRCESKDHFHALVTSNHLCGFEHTCMAECEARGICQIVTDMVKREKTFHGKRSQFEYEHLSEQNGIRKNCCKPIPPGQQNHEGEHTHTEDGAKHFCDVKCMACGYFCNLPIDHPLPHDTTHGNMRDLYFAAESEEIDIQDRQYVWGESGIAEMCMMHCRAQGRGHIHLVECKGFGAWPPKRKMVQPESAGNQLNEADVAGSSSTHQREFPCLIALLDGARHQTRRYGPNVNVPKDELTHVAYWEYLRFKDPCPDEQFGLCGHFCESEEHVSTNTSRERSYCTEKIWHRPVTKESRLSAGARSGHVTADGHFLPCNHHSDLSHIVFVIDRSGSMCDLDFKPSMSKFSTLHNNRLGCVYESLFRFIRKRPAHGDKDLVSIILFNNRATLVVDRLPLDESAVDHLLPYEPDGGTSYSEALGLVAKHLQIVTPSGDTTARERPPVVILLGDGESWGAVDDQKSMKLVNEMKVVNSKLVLHTIFCGQQLGGRDLMRELAAAGGGTFTVNIDEVELTKTFEVLARTLRPQVNSPVIPSRKRS